MMMMMMMTVCDHEYDDDDDDAGGEHFLYLCNCWLSLHQGAVGPNTVAWQKKGKQASFDKTLQQGREKVKIGAVFVKCVVFNTSCVVFQLSQ